MMIRTDHRVESWMLEYAAVKILLDHLLEQQLKPHGSHLTLGDCFTQGLKRVSKKLTRAVLADRLSDYGFSGVETWHEDAYDAPTEDDNPEILEAIREKIAALFPEVQ